MNAPSSGLAEQPPSWNGTPGFPPSTKCMAKRSKPIDSLKILKTKPSTPKRQTAREFLELQRLMAGAVMRPLAATGRMQRKWRDDRLTSFERLEIYNRQYWYRIKDCFYEDYPGLRAILGERRFERLADAYLVGHPSQSFTLRNLGRRLVAFLEEIGRASC